jgi:hypothetical protein
MGKRVEMQIKPVKLMVCLKMGRVNRNEGSQPVYGDKLEIYSKWDV